MTYVSKMVFVCASIAAIFAVQLGDYFGMDFLATPKDERYGFLAVLLLIGYVGLLTLLTSVSHLLDALSESEDCKDAEKNLNNAFTDAAITITCWSFLYGFQFRPMEQFSTIYEVLSAGSAFFPVAIVLYCTLFFSLLFVRIIQRGKTA